MFPLGVALTWAGYGLGSWGWVLVKGYDIPLRSWFSPLHPWQWPASTSATIPRVPKGRVFPGPPPGTGKQQKPPGNSIYNVPGVGPILHGIRGLL